MQLNIPGSSAVNSILRRGGSSGQSMLPWLTGWRGSKVASRIGMAIYTWSGSASRHCSANFSVSLESGSRVLCSGGKPGAGREDCHPRLPSNLALSTLLIPQCAEVQLQNFEGRIWWEEGGGLSLEGGRWQSQKTFGGGRTSKPWLGFATGSHVGEDQEGARVGVEHKDGLTESITTVAANSATVAPESHLFKLSNSWKSAGRTWRGQPSQHLGLWSSPWGRREILMGLARTSQCSSREHLKQRARVLHQKGKLLPQTFQNKNNPCFLHQSRPRPQEKQSWTTLPPHKLRGLVMLPNGQLCGRAFRKGSVGVKSWRRSHPKGSHPPQHAPDMATLSQFRSSICLILFSFIARVSSRSALMQSRVIV